LVISICSAAVKIKPSQNERAIIVFEKKERRMELVCLFFT
jgi:hypothetical protein